LQPPAETALSRLAGNDFTVNRRFSVRVHSIYEFAFWVVKTGG
jgi:hypothetical protein